MSTRWYDEATPLSGVTPTPLSGEESYLARLTDGRIGYATPDAFRPFGMEDELEEVVVNPGQRRGTAVVSLGFAGGEFRETLDESAATVTKRLRAAGWIVSARALGRAAAPPADQPVEHPGDDEPAEELEVVPADLPSATSAPRPVPTPAPRPVPTAGRPSPTGPRRPAPTLADDDRATVDPAAVTRHEEPPPATPTAGRSTDETPRSETPTDQRPTGETPTDETPRSETPTEETPTKQERERTSSRAAAGAVAARFFGRGTLALLRSAVLLVGGVVVAILVLQILLVLLKANPQNGIVRFFDRTSKPLAWQFKDLFTPRTRRANIAENYGIAAVVYLLVALAASRVLARLGTLFR